MALSQVAVAGVPRSLDCIRTDEWIACVQEWVTGSALDSLSAAGARAAISDLVDVVQSAHLAGWIHGDLKLSNFIVDSEDQIWIVDWESARRIGERSAPGTLGYAPPWAWKGHYAAEPRNDLYSLAVVVAELIIGRRLFEGSRTDVLAAQEGAHLLECVPAEYELARALLRCADLREANLPGCAYDRAQPDVRVLRRSLKPYVERAVRESELYTAATDCRRIVVRVPCKVDDGVVANAVADFIRVSLGANCIALADHVGSLPEQGLESVVGLDPLADLRATVAAKSRLLFDGLRGMAPVILLVERRNALGSGSLAWRAVSDLLERHESAGTRVYMVGTTVCEDLAVGERDAWVRTVVEAVVGTFHVPRELLAAARRAASCDADAVLGVLRSETKHPPRAQRSGRSDDDLVIRVGDTNDVADAGPSDSKSVASETVGIASIDDWIRLGVRSAVAGDVGRAISSGIHATTLALDGSSCGQAQRVLLADLWIEVGRPDAAIAVLEMRSIESMSVAELHALGRACAAAGNLKRLRDVLEAMPRVDEDSHELTRFRAILDAAAGRLRDAGHGLASVLRDRNTLPVPVVLRSLATLANVLRRSGKSASALAVLNWVSRRADQIGAVRVRLAVDANRLLAGASDAGSERTAIAWESLYRECERWGILSGALANAIRASRRWRVAGSSPQARRLMSELGSGLRVAAGPHWREQLEWEVAEVNYGRMHTVAGERADAWAWWRDTAAASAASAVSQYEVGTIGTATLRSRLPSGRAPILRGLRLACRVAESSPRSAGRIQALVPKLLREIRGDSAYLASVCRIIAREWDSEAVASTLSSLRDRFATAGGRLGDACMTAHILAMAWWTSADDESVAWLHAQAVFDDWARPIGVAEWEWRLALGISEVRSGSRDPSEELLETVLAPVEEAARALPRSLRASFLARAPLELTAELCAVQLPTVWDHDEESVSMRRLTRIRASLHRAGSGHAAERCRTAALERVLESALRLKECGSVTEVLERTVNEVSYVSQAERAVLVWEDAASPDSRQVWTATGGTTLLGDVATAEVSQSVLRRVREAGAVCVLDDATDDEGLQNRPSIRRFRPRSVMAAPLRREGETFGYLYVENRTKPRSFSQFDGRVFEGFAAQASLAIENARLVTQLKSSVVELADARLEAVRAESLRALGRMAGEVAHDFNNLLTTILGEAQLVLQGEDSGKHADSLRVIERASLDGAAVVRRIQESTRTRDSVRPTAVDLGQIVRDVLTLTRARLSAAEGGVTVTCEIPPRIAVLGVESELRELFTNLVVNAVDAMAGTGALRVVVERVRLDAIVEIADSGGGMPESVLGQVFEPFFTTKGRAGTGLGLSIARRIVEAHGGDIEIASDDGVGTTVRTRFPVLESAEVLGRMVERQVTPGDADSGESTGSSVSARRVLIVDDEVAIASVLSRIVRVLGYESRVVSSAAEVADALAGRRSWDVVFTDLCMPDQGGLDVAAQVRDLQLGTPVVIMTGFGGSLDPASIQEHGVASVLRKPFSLEEVRSVLGSLCDRAV